LQLKTESFTSPAIIAFCGERRSSNQVAQRPIRPTRSAQRVTFRDGRQVSEPPTGQASHDPPTLLHAPAHAQAISGDGD